MLKTAGHVKGRYKECCKVYEDFKNRGTNNATFKEYLSFVETSSQSIKDPDEQMSYKGDMLEILAEIFFKAFQNSPVVGLTDYIPVPLEEDYGVDGYGINAIGKKCAVQVKYRHNPLDHVLYAEIARTYTSGILQLKLPLDGDDCIFVFTSAYDVTVACKTVFGKMVRVLDYNVISHEIDNNVSFWNLAFEEIKETLLGK